MAIQKESSAQVNALERRWLEGGEMSKTEAVLLYTSSMAMFKKWKVDGLISEDELLKIDAILTKKYGLGEGSIYREKGEHYAHYYQKQTLCVQDS